MRRLPHESSCTQARSLAQFSELTAYPCLTHFSELAAYRTHCQGLRVQVITDYMNDAGSYGHYGVSGAVMQEDALPISLIESFHNRIPNYSMRMTNLTAALLRPQLDHMDSKIQNFNRHWDIIHSVVSSESLIQMPLRHFRESKVGTSFLFFLPSFDSAAMAEYVRVCGERGVPVAWFGRPNPVGFTSTLSHWEYVYDNKPEGEAPDEAHMADAEEGLFGRCQETGRLQRTLCDVPLYHTSSWSDEDFQEIATILCVTAQDVSAQASPC